jgi:hypothetical protein
MVHPQLSLVFQSNNCKSANFSPLDSQDEAPFLKVKYLLDNFMAKKLKFQLVQLIFFITNMNQSILRLCIFERKKLCFYGFAEVRKK